VLLITPSSYKQLLGVLLEWSAIMPYYFPWKIKTVLRFIFYPGQGRFSDFCKEEFTASIIFYDV
jgi:hypothetical protein